MDLKKIEDKIITVQGKAVKNNPDRFPEGYIITLTDNEMRPLRSKFSTLENAGRGKNTRLRKQLKRRRNK